MFLDIRQVRYCLYRVFLNIWQLRCVVLPSVFKHLVTLVLILSNVVKSFCIGKPVNSEARKLLKGSAREARRKPMRGFPKSNIPPVVAHPLPPIWPDLEGEGGGFTTDRSVYINWYFQAVLVKWHQKVSNTIRFSSKTICVPISENLENNENSFMTWLLS